jgi:prepilin-type N-terminal cleavage/methylation domain-containing protein
MNRKGFTLVELLMVVIIIGILVTLAVPSYYKSIERAKGSKAKASLRTITNAQVQYRALHDTYCDSAAIASLADVDLPTELQSLADGDWTYACVAGTTGDITSSVSTSATRNLGPYIGQIVTMDQDGLYDNAAGAGPQEWN